MPKKNPIQFAPGPLRIPSSGGECCLSTMTDTRETMSMYEALENVANGGPPFPNCPFHGGDRLSAEAVAAAKFLLGAHGFITGIAATVLHERKVVFVRTAMGEGLFELAKAGVVDVRFEPNGSMVAYWGIRVRPKSLDHRGAVRSVAAIQAFAFVSTHEFVVAAAPTE